MIIVRREEGDLRWATIKRRLRLNTPRDPATGVPRARLWLWVVPFLVAVVVFEGVLTSPIQNAWVSVFPFFAESQGYSFDAIFESQEILERLVGAWWFFALFVIYAVFNTILGEEFSFSGRALAQDGRCVRTRELGGEQRTIRSLSRSPALGNTGLVFHRTFVHLPCLSLQEYMDVYHPALRTERVLRLLGAWGRVGVSLEGANFRELRKAEVQLRRISLIRASVK